MSALSTSRLPNLATPAPTTTPTSTAAAPQLAGNSAAQDRLGTGVPLEDTGGSFDEVLATMGALGAVVLEAMPLPIAIRAALRLKQAWTRDWLDEQPAREVYLAAPAEARKALDMLAPVGLGFELGVYASGDLVAGLAVASRASVERVTSGFLITAETVTDISVGASEGLGLKGAGDATVAGIGAGIKASAQNTGAAEWEIPVMDVMEHLATFEVGAIHDLLAGRPLDPAALIRALECLARTIPPRLLRLSGGVSGEAGGSAEADLNMDMPIPLAQFAAAAKRSASACLRFGTMGTEPFVELHGESEDVLKHPVLQGLGLPKMVGTQLTVRVIGAAPRYAIVAQRKEDDVTVEDTYETTDLASAGAWLVGLLAAPYGHNLEGELVAPEALPDVTLTRSAHRAYEDLMDLPGEVIDRMWAARLEGLDAGMTTPFVDLDVEAEVEGTVRVPTDAVRAALEGRGLPVGEEEPEVAVLEAARTLAAHAIGGRTYASTNADLLDLEAGVEHVELEGLSLKSKIVGKAGIGGALTVAGVSGGASAAATWRTDLSALDAEQRRDLVAG